MCDKIVNISLHTLSMMAEKEQDNKALWGTLYEDNTTYTLSFLKEKGICRISDLIFLYKNSNEVVKKETFLTEYLDFSTIYIEYNDIYLGMDIDMNIENLFFEFDATQLSFIILYSPGGASIEREGYTFAVRSKENNHQHLPHIHVSKGDVVIRYNLLTNERFEDDYYVRLPKKDEKKIIHPILNEKHEMFMEWWKLTEKGFRTPIVDTNMTQFYGES